MSEQANDRQRVEHRCERTIHLAASPEQVWEAITTADGNAAWMVPTTIDARLGGKIAFELGENLSSRGQITVFEPPLRFAYQEPDWPLLANQDPTGTSPMATEFLIEAVSGGSTTLRVVTSAFGTGADWENEFFTNMSNSWLALLDNLRLYVTHFDTKPVTIAKVSVDTVATDANSLKVSLRRALNIHTISQLVDTPEGRATVERHDDTGPLLLRLDEPAAKIVEIEVWPNSGETICELTARCFNPSAPLQSETWKLWLTEATIPAL